MTRRSRDVASVVRFRASLGPCYVLRKERGLVDLWIPTMLASGEYEPLWTLREATVKAAVDSGTVQIGPVEESDDVPGMPPGRLVAALTGGVS